eukprot:254076-Pyramimonas_sp.AAC.1
MMLRTAGGSSGGVEGNDLATSRVEYLSPDKPTRPVASAREASRSQQSAYSPANYTPANYASPEPPIPPSPLHAEKQVSPGPA